MIIALIMKTFSTSSTITQISKYPSLDETEPCLIIKLFFNSVMILIQETIYFYCLV